MSPELQAIYRKKVAYGEDQDEALRYVENLEKSRSSPKTSISKVSDKNIIERNGKLFRSLHTCVKRNFKKKVVEPQMQEQDRPPPHKWMNHLLGYTCVEKGVYKCQLCPFTAKATNSIGQHCLKHFPSKYNCEECGDQFSIKTQLINHFNVECLQCGKTVKHGSMASHSCKYTKRFDLSKIGTWVEYI
jgi:hypothetical protein